MKKRIIVYSIVAVFAAVAVWLAFFSQYAQDAEQSGIANMTDDWQSYTNADLGFQAKLPIDYSINESYYYTELGPGKEIPGVAFMIPESITEGTNLSEDSSVSVEKLARASCTPADFLDLPSPSISKDLGAETYQYATSSGAGAGNFYEESIYVRPVQGSCYGIRFFIHSTNIHNYDPGTVKEFDRAGLLSTFEQIASTVRFI